MNNSIAINRHFLRSALFSAVIWIAGITGYSQNPSISSFTPASGPVGTLVTITGTNLSAATVLAIGGVSGIIVSDSATKLVGMVMPGAVTGSISITTTTGSISGINNFTVSPTPYPSVQQGSKLTGSDATAGASQGTSVSISADGNTAVVGAPADNNNAGAATIYTRSGTTWTQQGNKLVGTGAVGAAQQGYSVSMSADGNTVIVGGPADNTSVGAAWIYTRSGGAWTQQGSKLVSTDYTGAAQQGYAVSISADGKTAMVGGPYNDNSAGAAWIYTRSGSTWTQQGAKLVGTGVGNANQGWSVSISADGNNALVGGPYYDAGQGAAWVFTRSGITWTQQGAKLTYSYLTNSTDELGSSVSISANGNTAILEAGGLPGNDLKTLIFTRSAGVWSQQFDDNNLAIYHSWNGSAASLTADGNTALTALKNATSGSGAASTVSFVGNEWYKGGTLTGTGATGNAEQGWSVGISADGSTAISGGPMDNSGKGAAWVFISLPLPSIISYSPTSGPAGTLVTFTGTNLNNASSLTIGGVPVIIVSDSGSKLVAMVMPGTVTGAIEITTVLGISEGPGNFTVLPTPYPAVQQGSKLKGTGAVQAASLFNSVAVSADGNTAIVGGYADNGYIGAAWVFTRQGPGWTQQGNKLVANDYAGIAYQGISVSISADGNTAVVGGSGDNNGIGAAWIYIRSGSGWLQQGAKLVANDYSGNSFQGQSVSLSADGNTALIGGDNDNDGIGAAWIFIRTDSAWSQPGKKLIGTGALNGATGANQGYSVALSADGKNAVVAGLNDAYGTGAAWIFTRTDSTWLQQGSKLVGTAPVGIAQQGLSVSLSANGNTALVGGWSDSLGAGTGTAWIFSRSGGLWTQQGDKLIGSGAEGGVKAGNAVSLSADGNTALMGVSSDYSGNGATWVFTRSGTTWSQQRTKLVGTGSSGNAYQGSSVGLSADGSTAIIGGPLDNNAQGAGWIFVTSKQSATLSLYMDTVAGVAQGQVVVTVKVGGFNELISAQGTILFNPSNLTLADVEQYGLSTLDSSSIGVTGASSGKLTFSWYDPSLSGTTMAEGSVFFALRFNLSNSTAQSTSLTFGNSPTLEEYVDTTFSPITVSLKPGMITVATDTISGYVRTETGQGVQIVTVSATGGQVYTTDTSGAFNFAFPGGSTDTIIPQKSNDSVITNGVTTVDILLIQSDILKRKLLSSPYKLIAADVNSSGTITTVDLLLIQELILKKITSFPGDKLWAFVPASYVFPNQQDPFPFPLSLTFSDVTTQSNQNFIGMKLGDVNDSWSPNIRSAPAPETVGLQMDITSAAPQSEISVPVRASNFKNVSGMQYTIEWDADKLEFSSLDSAQSALQVNYGESEIQQGRLAIEWTDPDYGSTTLPDNSPLFFLKFSVKGSVGESSPLKITSSMAIVEVVDSSLQIDNYSTTDGAVNIERATTGITELSTLQEPVINVSPNPFNGSTNLSFRLYNSANIMIQVYNELGQEIEQTEANYNAGAFKKEIGNDWSEGVYFIRFTAGDYVQALKVINTGK